MFGIKHDMTRNKNNVRPCKTTSLGMPPHPLSYVKVISGSNLSSSSFLAILLMRFLGQLMERLQEVH
jgi:hypothetical protein